MQLHKFDFYVFCFTFSRFAIQLKICFTINDLLRPLFLLTRPGEGSGAAAAAAALAARHPGMAGSDSNASLTRAIPGGGGRRRTLSGLAPPHTRAEAAMAEAAAKLVCALSTCSPPPPPRLPTQASAPTESAPALYIGRFACMHVFRPRESAPVFLFVCPIEALRFSVPALPQQLAAVLAGALPSLGLL